MDADILLHVSCSMLCMVIENNFCPFVYELLFYYYYYHYYSFFRLFSFSVVLNIKRIKLRNLHGLGPVKQCSA